ncbi:MAG: hypothetical protein RR101_00840 [Burkholderiaceae bacterium]
MFELIQRLGSSSRVKAGEFLFGDDDPVDQLIYVHRGLIGRAVRDPSTQLTMALAFSPPGRMAAGTLNFFSGIPCVGKYFAFEASEIIRCPQAVCRAIVYRNPELLRCFAIHAEQFAMSNRLTGSAHILLPVKKRLPLLFLAWASAFGQLSKRSDTDGLWIQMPIPAIRSNLARLINSSLITIDRQLADWRSTGLFLREHNTLWLRPVLVEESLDWLCRLDETARHAQRPVALKALLSQNESPRARPQSL